METMPQNDLFSAIESGNADSVASILASGVDPVCHMRERWIPLHLACYCRHIDVVILLLNHGVDINSKNASGWTALHWACANGGNSKGLIELLIERGADIRIRDHQTRQALDRLPRWKIHFVKLFDEINHINS